jgi:pimeloyl-ACP methyl ester carboxylesterase
MDPRTRSLARIALGAALALALPAHASPPFETSQADLEASLTCPGPLDGPGPDPVLLVHGTASDRSQYAWNYEPALAALGIPYCLIDMLEFGEGDAQLSAERVVYALLEMHAASGDRIDVIGHSQGGMLPRWALKYWPETRAIVDDFVGHAPSNHGTPLASGICASGGCGAAEWQQASESNFLAYLNDGPETFAGIDYTVVYTLTDEIVFPQAGPDASSPLREGEGDVTNVALQEVCPNDANEHLAIGTYDAVAWALTLDALEHDGPADPSRLAPTVCAEPFMPGVDPETFASDYAGSVALIAEVQGAKTQVPEEPPLKPYVFLPEPSPATGLLAGGAALLALRRRRVTRRRVR